MKDDGLGGGQRNSHQAKVDTLSDEDENNDNDNHLSEYLAMR